MCSWYPCLYRNNIHVPAVVIFKVASLAPAWLPNAMWPPWKKQYMGKNDDVIKWKHFPRYWPFVRGIHRSPVNSPHKGQWRGALMFSMICSLINGWVNNREAGDLRRHLAHYDVIVMCTVTIYMYLQWWYSRLLELASLVTVLLHNAVWPPWKKHMGKIVRNNTITKQTTHKPCI